MVRVDGEVARREFTHALAKKLGQIIGVESVGLDEDFFELGGDSLGAVELAVWAEQLVGRRVPTPTLFSHSTPQELADYLIALMTDA